MPPSWPGQGEQDEDLEPPGCNDQTLGVGDFDVGHRAGECDDAAQSGAAVSIASLLPFLGALGAR